jgi:hypothetical protein
MIDEIAAMTTVWSVDTDHAVHSAPVNSIERRFPAPEIDQAAAGKTLTSLLIEADRNVCNQQRGCGHFHPVTRRAPCCTMPDKFGGLPSTLVPHGWIRPLFVGAVSAGAPASIRASWSLPVIKLADAQGMAIFIASARSRAYATPTAMGTDISVIEALALIGLGERGESPRQGRPHRGVSRANRWRPVVAQHGWQMTGPTRRW